MSAENLFKLFLKLLNITEDTLLKEQTIVKHYKKILHNCTNNQALEFLDYITDSHSKEKVISETFGAILKKFEKRKALELLDSISHRTTKEEAIAKAYDIIVDTFENRESLQFLNTISDRKLQEEAIYRASASIISRFDNHKALELLDYISIKSKKEKAIAKAYGMIIDRFDKDKALELLNSISNMGLKENTIIKYYRLITENLDISIEEITLFSKETLYNNIDAFHTLFKKNRHRAFELLAYSDFKEEEQYQAINSSFSKLVEIDRFMAFETLKIVSKERADEIIINHIPSLIKIYLNNHKIKNRIFDLIEVLHNQQLRNQLIIDYFEIFFDTNAYKALINFRYLKRKNQRIIIVESFQKLIQVDTNRAIKLLTATKDRALIDSMGSLYFKEIFIKNKKLAIRLIKEIENIPLQNEVIENSFEILQHHSKEFTIILNLLSNKKMQTEITLKVSKELIHKDFNGLIELLNQLNDKALKEKIIWDTTKELTQKNNLSKIITLLNKTAERELQVKVKKEYKNLIQTSMQEHIDKLYTLENSHIEREKEHIIEEAYSSIEIENKVELESASVEKIALLVRVEENLTKQRELLNLMITKMEDEADRDYSKIAYKVIVNRKIFISTLYNALKPFIKSGYFEEKLKEFKEQKETEQGINRMLGKVLKSPQSKRESTFMKQFKRHRKIKNLHTIIPQVSKHDFELAQGLLKSINKKEDVLEAQREIFLIMYQKQFSKALESYQKIDDFYIKVELSKIVLDFFVPQFRESFFIKAMMILDNQNIAHTPKNLVQIEPIEVLQYYGEIENKGEKTLEEILKKVVRLQLRADEAEADDDDERWEEIEAEERQLKESLRSDEKVLKLFLEQFNIQSFRRLSLLDIVI